MTQFRQFYVIVVGYVCWFMWLTSPWHRLTRSSVRPHCASTVWRSRYIYFTRIIVYLMAITLTFKLVRAVPGML